MGENYDRIGREILLAVRNELYMNFPYMDVPLCALEFQPSEAAGSTAEPSGKDAADIAVIPTPAGPATSTMATDGQTLFYNGRWLADRYLKSRPGMNRAYLHTIFHCLLRHLWKGRGKDQLLWDIACDAAVEALLGDLNYPCLNEGLQPGRIKFLSECSQTMRVITAEAVYHKLRRENRDPMELTLLRSTFLVDDHSFWASGQDRDRSRPQDQEEQRWKDMAEKSLTAIETMFRDQSDQSGAIREQLRVAVRDGVDYRAFLRRFAAPREVVQLDPDHFDYIFYTYGLQLYGNMPLVEPLETREEKRIEDLGIAVDTSMSTSGELVHAFLACTYAILRSTETYTRKVNIHIIQCDNKVRADDAIHDLDELHEYMSRFRLKGGGSTDFRPVFRYVNELIENGTFTDLRGLIYFTDGMGFYPKARPAYDTAFVFLGDPPASVPVPPWAIRLTLEAPELMDTLASVEEEEPELIDWDELPRT